MFQEVVDIFRKRIWKIRRFLWNPR